MGDNFVRCAFSETNPPETCVTDGRGLTRARRLCHINAQMVRRILVESRDRHNPPLRLATAEIELPAGDRARLYIEAAIPASIGNPLVTNLLEAFRRTAVFKCPISNHFSVETTIHAVVNLLKEDAIHVFVDGVTRFVGLDTYRYILCVDTGCGEQADTECGCE